MFNLWVWFLFFVLFLFLFIFVSFSYYSHHDSGKSVLLGLPSIFFWLGMGCFVVFCISVVNAETLSSNPNVNYGEVNTIKSIEQTGYSLKISTTDSNDIIHNQEFDLDYTYEALGSIGLNTLHTLNTNTDVTSPDFNVPDGDAILSDSDKKVVEKVTVTRTKTVDYHCPLIKNSTKEKTTTYYIVYYPLDELNVNK